MNQKKPYHIQMSEGYRLRMEKPLTPVPNLEVINKILDHARVEVDDPIHLSEIMLMAAVFQDMNLNFDGDREEWQQSLSHRIGAIMDDYIQYVNEINGFDGKEPIDSGTIYLDVKND